MEILAPLFMLVGLCLLIAMVALLFAYAGWALGIAGWFLAACLGGVVVGKMIKANNG